MPSHVFPHQTNTVAMIRVISFQIVTFLTYTLTSHTRSLFYSSTGPSKSRKRSVWMGTTVHRRILFYKNFLEILKKITFGTRVAYKNVIDILLSSRLKHFKSDRRIRSYEWIPTVLKELINSLPDDFCFCSTSFRIFSFFTRKQNKKSNNTSPYAAGV